MEVITVPSGDLSLLLENLNGNHKIVKEVIELFIAEYPVILAEIKKAVARKDAVRLYQSAHKLYGITANFGAEAVDQLLLQLENIGKSGTTEGTPEIVRQVGERLEKLRLFLVEFE